MYLENRPLACFSALVLLCLAGCQQDNDATQEPAPATDMAAPDAGPEPDMAAPNQDAAPPAVDAAPPAPDMATPDDACERACIRFGDCSIERCDGYGPQDAAALANTCAEACAQNPAFATVINGADTCQTIVDFGRDQGDPAYAAACRDGAGPVEPDGSQCPYPCAEAEVCNQGHCVRPDGTCETDYHCRFATETCLEGACVTAQFAECRGDLDCSDESQVCLSFSQNPLEPGNCYFACEENVDCPSSESCNRDAGNICYYDFCGPGSVNGDVYGECRVGDWDGLCYPLPEGNRNAQGVPGICLEAAGDRAFGEPCDAQSLGRDADARATQCAAPGICFGDPDDPRDPNAALDGQGTCTVLCDPRAPDCAEGTFCLDFTNPDDPSTQGFDDTRFIGVCLPSDCDVFDAENACGEGRACRLYTAASTRGFCADVGQTAEGQGCGDSDECAGVAFCGNNGVEESVCIPVCDPAAEAACGEGQVCFAQDGWVIGFCINAGE